MKPIRHLRRATKAVILALSVTALIPAQAGTALWCSGTIATHWIDAGGTVYVLPSWRGDHIALCNVNANSAAGITPTVCLGWAAIIRAAMQRSAPTTIHYGDAPVASCSQIPTYQSAPSPSYLMLQ